MPESLLFRNSSRKKIKLVLEPWAEEYPLNDGVTVKIQSEKQTTSSIEVEFDGEDIIVYGWSDEMSVWIDGTKIEPTFERGY
ncbi:hypothetical protein [Hahella ganghwensis]|uniref:hypothetical protein n=1 Tax=Hahella ganghwensis TaxID=286420 RepID=UPI000364422B|nr:hypothetical protein [Hahella ganghwensis]